MVRTGFGCFLAAAFLMTASPAVLPAGEPLSVTVSPAAEVFTRIVHSAPATAAVLQRTEVAARLAAPVEAFEVEVGDRLERGAPLVRLECVDAEDGRDSVAAALAEAEARAGLARLRLQRIERLRAQDAVSADEFDQAEAERRASAATVAARRAELVRARRDVERCTVHAPEAGMVTARHADAGDYVQPGMPLLTLVAESRIEVRADVTATDAQSLLSARDVHFRADGENYRLEAARRTGLVAADTGTEEIRLRFADKRPRPGLAGRVYWRSGHNALPAHLLVRRAGRLGVFTVRDGHARFHAIDDAVEGRPAPTDLAPATRLVIEGRHAATDGMPLKILE